MAWSGLVRAGDTGLGIFKVYSVPAFRNFDSVGLGLNCKEGVSRILTGHTYDSMAGLTLDRGVLETFCAERVRLALNTSCPATEHHHCCSRQR